MNKKKLYEKPAMQVFELKQRQQLLQSSSPGGGDIPGNGYPGQGDPFNF